LPPAAETRQKPTELPVLPELAVLRAEAARSALGVLALAALHPLAALRRGQ